MKISIIVPAYNEEKRIEKTLKAYASFFSFLPAPYHAEILVVLNGCKDNTLPIVKTCAQEFSCIRFLNLQESGKGLAIVTGFKDALTRSQELIGFVDADMATTPKDFFELITSLGEADGVIASRYMPGSVVFPKEQPLKVYGSRFFNAVLRLLFWFPFKDTQCGAKIFRAYALRDVIPHISSMQWAFDVDLLFWLTKKGYVIKEIPTTWSDQKYSTFNNNVMGSGLRMLGTCISLRIKNIF